MRKLGLATGWALVAAIVWLSVMPDPPEPDFTESDKVGHVLAYGGVTFWFCLLYVRRSTRLAYAAGFAAMGIALELVQGGLGYRSFDPLDIAANALGVALGLAVALALPRILK